MKNQKGITLIALVITIIVLLILAGVAIAMLSGDNGILNNASKSADYNKIGEVKDQIGLAVNENVMNYLDKVHNNGTEYTGDAESTAEVVAETLTSFITGNAKAPTNGVTVTFAGTLPTDASTVDVTVATSDYQVVGKVNASGSVAWGDITKVTKVTEN